MDIKAELEILAKLHYVAGTFLDVMCRARAIRETVIASDE